MPLGGAESVLNSLPRQDTRLTVGLGEIQALHQLGWHEATTLIELQELGGDPAKVLDDPAWLMRAAGMMKHRANLVLHHHFGLSLAADSTSSYYLHTPTRVLWEPHLVPWETERVSPQVSSWMADREASAISRARYLVANSFSTAERVEKSYGRDAIVLYPPTDFWKLGESRSFPGSLPPKYLFTASRLAPGKRLGPAIAAMKDSPVPWLIAGAGRAERELRSQAPSSVRFLGPVSNPQLHALIAGAACCIGTSVEDFGLFVAEAMTLGQPVVCQEGSGVLELREFGVCESYADPEVDGGRSLRSAVDRALVKQVPPSGVEHLRRLLDPGRFSARLMELAA